MKTFIVHAKSRRVRATDTSKAIVVAEDPSAALELVRNFYGPAVAGWKPGTTFEVVGVIQENEVKFI